MTFWDKVKKDLQKEIRAGVTLVKEGAAVVKKRAEELTEEGMKQYKLMELKGRVRDWFAELGGKVYELNTKGRDPMADTSVSLIISRINKLESQIARLERASRTAPKKTPARSGTRRKKGAAPKGKGRKSS